MARIVANGGWHKSKPTLVRGQFKASAAREYIGPFGGCGVACATGALVLASWGEGDKSGAAWILPFAVAALLFAGAALVSFVRYRRLRAIEPESEWFEEKPPEHDPRSLY
jgi:hypothetical protein